MNYFKFLKTSTISFLLFFLLFNISQAQITLNSDFEGDNGVASFINQQNNEVHLTSEYKSSDTRNIVFYAEI